MYLIHGAHPHYSISTQTTHGISERLRDDHMRRRSPEHPYQPLRFEESFKDDVFLPMFSFRGGCRWSRIRINDVSNTKKTGKDYPQICLK